MKIFIVGGSSGIGLSLAKRYASLGNRVAICGTNEEKLKKIEEEMTDIMKFNDSVIMTIPGIGYINGGMILGEIGDIHRFSNPTSCWLLPVWIHLFTSPVTFRPDEHGCLNAAPVY